MEMEPVYLGSQLFINKNDTPDMVRSWVRLMDENRLKIIRLFMVWDQLEPHKGQWEYKNYDACFDEAEARGMLIVPTLMAVSPPGWMLLTNGSQSMADLDDSSFWNVNAREYIEKVVGRYSGSPALHSWILWNEPARWIKKGKHSIAAYVKYLRQKYNDDITNLNDKYFSTYNNFNELHKMNETATNSIQFGSFTEGMDWIFFSVDNLNEKLKDIIKEIKKIDLVHPIHVNAHNVGQNLLNGGQSVWREAEFVDFLGCSAHPPWHSRRFPSERIHQSIAYFSDIMKSSTPHPQRLFWVTELQGGPTTFSSPTYTCPSDLDIKHWIWESVASGARAVVFWCFNTRSNGNEGGEWGLLNQLGKPSSRLLEAKKAAAFIDEHRNFFDAARPEMGDVTLLCSEATWAMGWLEGYGESVSNPRNKHVGSDAMAGAYLMCSDLGLTVNLIDEKLLKSRKWPENSRVLLLPSVTSLEEGSAEAIIEYVSDGGIVIADGLCAMKDADGNITYGELDKLSKVFGMRVEDIKGDESSFSFMSEESGECVPGWFVRILPELGGGRCQAKFDDQSAAVVAGSCGKGSGIRIGTVLFQHYLSNHSTEALNFFKSLLPAEIINKPVSLVNPSYLLRMRRLRHPDGELLILLNRGGEAAAELMTCAAGRLEQIGTENSYQAEAGSVLHISMQAGEIKSFIWLAENKGEGGVL